MRAPEQIIFEHINRIVFPGGSGVTPTGHDIIPLIPRTRRGLVDKLGIQRESIHTDDLYGPDAAITFFGKLFDADAKQGRANKTLLIVPGRLSNGWGEFIRRIYASIGNRTDIAREEIRGIDGSLYLIFEEIEAIRAQMHMSLETETEVPADLIESSVRRVLKSVPPDLDNLRNAVKNRVIMILLTNGADYLLSGLVAADPRIGLIDGALLTESVYADPKILRDAVVKSLAVRSLV